jgi:hypothetical protein
MKEKSFGDRDLFFCFIVYGDEKGEIEEADTREKVFYVFGTFLGLKR